MSHSWWSTSLLSVAFLVLACSSNGGSNPPSGACTEGAIETATACPGACGEALHPVCHAGIFSCASSASCDGGTNGGDAASPAPEAGDPTLITCGTMSCSATTPNYCLVLNLKDDAGASTPSQFLCTTIPVFCTPTPTCACVLDYSSCDAEPGATPTCVEESGNIRITCAN